MNRDEYETKKGKYMEDDEGNNNKENPMHIQTKNIPDNIKEMVDDSKQHEIPEQEKETDPSSHEKNLSELSRESIEELPDLNDFMHTEEFIRMGTDMRIPLMVDVNGRKFKVYIRPLSSNEFYKLQLKQMREKKSLDYLACLEACYDSNDNHLEPRLLDKLGFSIITSIGGAIRIASGDTTDEDNEVRDELIRNLLEE